MTDPTTAPGRAEIRRVCDDATAGPWYDDGGKVIVDSRFLACCNRPDTRDGSCCGVPDVDGQYGPVADAGPEDAAFIALARTALPAALDEIERLTAELAKFECRIYDREPGT